MKTSPILLLAVSLGFLAAPGLNAQDQSNKSDAANPPAEARRGKGERRGPGPVLEGRGQLMNPAARVAELDRQVGLSPAQKTQLTDIFTRAREEMQGLRGAGGDRAANREKMQQMMQATRDEVQAVLTDEQRKKFEATGPRGPKGERGARGDRPPGGPGKRKKGKAN